MSGIVLQMAPTKPVETPRPPSSVSAFQTAGKRIEYVDLSKRYGSFIALKPVNLTIEAGEFFAIIGPRQDDAAWTYRWVFAI